MHPFSNPLKHQKIATNGLSETEWRGLNWGSWKKLLKMFSENDMEQRLISLFRMTEVGCMYY